MLCLFFHLKQIIMQLENATRKRAKIKMALQGPSGSGKTYSALLIASGITGDWSKIAVIDTENHSSELYADLGAYKVLSLTAPYSPERYVEAIKVCEKAGIEVIIIDSITHEWDGQGGVLDTHGNMTGNSFTNWSKITPRHNAFVQALLQSPSHIISTIRTKQDYVLVEKNGKQVPEKVGMKGITRDGMDYEFTIVFDLDMKNNASVSKDRTALFTGKPEFKMTPETGKTILAWCNKGQVLPLIDDITLRINGCKSLDELLQLFMNHPKYQLSHHSVFTKRRAELQQELPKSILSNSQKTDNNGIGNSTS